jgi:hypothetical protein
MKILNHSENLVWYDGLQVFVAHDQFDTKFVCVLVEQKEQADTYLCAPISALRPRDLVEGKLDFRLVFENPEIEDLLRIQVNGENFYDMLAVQVPRTQVPLGWLPDHDCFLKLEAAPTVEVLEEAVSRKRAVIQYRLDPPEARIETKILVENLAQAIKVIQRLVKHAFRRTIRDLDKFARERLISPDYYQLEVLPLKSKGSFVVYMQSLIPPDLFGHVEISQALEAIDQVFEVSSVPTEAVQKVAELGPHFASAYKDLLKFVSDTETSFEYKWATPDRKTSRGQITVSQAIPLYTALSERTDIGVETVKLIGKLTKVDEKTKTWRLTSEEDQKEINGSSEIELAGLVIETQRYEFTCEERLEEERGSGREISKLYLKSFRPF